MRNEPSDKVLKLILILLEPRDYSISEICQKINISQRTFYYLVKFLRDQDFIIFKTKNSYHIDRRSTFISQISNSIQFSDSELRTIWNLLGMVGTGNETINTLRRKLDTAYDFSRSVNTIEARKRANIVKKLSSAIDRKRMVRLVDYSSPHSHTVMDRIVEPYLLMNNNQDVRCNELSTTINKTYKLARMKDVEVLETPWLHEDKHRQMFTDIFMFSGEDHHPVKVRLGQLSKDLFLEEYPQGAKNVQPDNEYENHWILELEVCDYRGIGRFVIGLYEDVEVLGDEHFKSYISDKIQAMYNKNFPDKRHL